MAFILFPVIHQGNTQSSEEEVEVIKNLANNLIDVPYWPKSEGENNKIYWMV